MDLQQTAVGKNVFGKKVERHICVLVSSITIY